MDTGNAVMSLGESHISRGATLAGDGIPLYFGDRRAEYAAALNAAVLMDRSHEGRLRLEGRDRLAITHRISTNAVETLRVGACAPTIFLNPNARIIDRVTVGNVGDTALMLTEPGRGEAVLNTMRRNIFFNDDLRLTDETAATRQFVLFGQRAEPIMGTFGAAIEVLHSAEVKITNVPVTVIHDKPFGGDATQDVWRLIVPTAEAGQVWEAVLTSGEAEGLLPAGSLTYHALRVRAGRPGVNAELSGEYIPLEVGLWDEISFVKGCYTGQEIIARMESRGKLARTIVRVVLDAPPNTVLNTPVSVKVDGKEVGKLTSSVETQFNEHFGIAVIRVAHAQAGVVLTIGDNVTATIRDRAGVQPEVQEE